jgi:hypothetical protein
MLSDEEREMFAVLLALTPADVLAGVVAVAALPKTAQRAILAALEAEGGAA